MPVISFSLGTSIMLFIKIDSPENFENLKPLKTYNLKGVEKIVFIKHEVPSVEILDLFHNSFCH